MDYIWTQKHASLDIQGNLCGDPDLPDLISQHASITFPHNEETLHLEFGSTMENTPDRGWWGISDL